MLAMVAMLAGCGSNPYANAYLGGAALQAGGNVLAHAFQGAAYRQPTYVVQPQVPLCRTFLNGLYIGNTPCVAGNVVRPQQFDPGFGYQRGSADYQQWGPYGNGQTGYAHIVGQRR
jgi:hypothetical protein